MVGCGGIEPLGRHPPVMKPVRLQRIGGNATLPILTGARGRTRTGVGGFGDRCSTLELHSLEMVTPVGLEPDICAVKVRYPSL
jgi:hypothetical protein